MANTKGREHENKQAFCDMMEEAYRRGKLIEDKLEVYEVLDDDDKVVVVVDKITQRFCFPKVSNNNNYKKLIEANLEVYKLLDDEGKAIAVLDKMTGRFLFTKAGEHKSNKRQYIRISIPGNDRYMCNNYIFRVVTEGLLGNLNIQSDRYNSYRKCVRYNINHINGNTQDNRDENLETDTVGLNNAHSRFMSEVHYYYPELIEEDEDCQGKKMHRWVDGVGVTCKQIREWNIKNPTEAIRAFKDNDDEWTAKLTKEQVTRMLRYFGKNI